MMQVDEEGLVIELGERVAIGLLCENYESELESYAAILLRGFLAQLHAYGLGICTARLSDGFPILAVRPLDS